MLAFFNSTAEGPMDGNKYEYGPVAKAPADQAAWDQWDSLLAEKKKLPDGAPTEGAEDLAKRIAEAQKAFTTTLVAAELPKPRETKLLARGEYDRPVGEPLSPGVPSVMNPFPEDAPLNRLGLARWLTSREHPLERASVSIGAASMSTGNAPARTR